MGMLKGTLSLSVYPMVGAKENSELLVTKSTSKFSFELASSKARVTSMRFQQQRWVSFSLLQGQTIIRLGCYKYGSTKTPVIIKVDWVLTLNAWDCCRNNLHFRVLFWPPEPAVWELFGFCWFASVCWIERGHFEFQTFPWLLDEKRFLLAKDILYQFQTQKKNHLGQISTKGEPLCEILKGFSAVSSYSEFRPHPVKGCLWTF